MANASKPSRRLDQPGNTSRRRFPTPNYDPEAFGQATERIARFLGTGRYLVYQSLIIGLWMVWNVTAPDKLRFDPYPLQFLTLILSLQAAYAAPLILLAQNRQDDRDRVNNLEDRGQARRNLEDTEFLARELADIRLALGEAVTRDFLRNELRDLLEEMSDRNHSASPQIITHGTGPAPTAAKKKKKRRRRPADSRLETEESLSEPQRPEPESDHEREPDSGTTDGAPDSGPATQSTPAPPAEAVGGHDSGEGPDLPMPPG